MRVKLSFFLITAFLLQTTMALASPDEANTSAQPISNAQGIREAFIEAATNGNLEVLRAIVPTQLGPNEAVFAGCMPLFYVVKYGKRNPVEMVQYLLGQGAEPNENILKNLFQEDWSRSGLNLSRETSKALSLLMVESKVKNIYLKSGIEILGIAIANNYPELVSAMLGAQLFRKEDFASTGINLGWEQVSFLEAALICGYPEIAAILVKSKLFDLQRGDNVDHFMKALKKGFYALADIWLKEVGDIENFVRLAIKRNGGPSIFLVNYLATRFGESTPLGKETQLMKALIEQDIDRVYQLGISSYTSSITKFEFYEIEPSVYILDNFDLDKIEKLLARGAYLKTPDHIKGGAKRAIAIACLLLTHRPFTEFSESMKYKLLYDAINSEDEDKIRFFIARGFALWHQEQFLKLFFNRPPIAQFFIVPGPSPINNKLFDSNVEIHAFEAATLFLQKGVDINHDHGKILNDSVLYWSLNRCKFLIEHGADIRLLRDDTVLAAIAKIEDRAEEVEITKLIQYLIENGYRPGQELLMKLRSEKYIE